MLIEFLCRFYINNSNFKKNMKKQFLMMFLAAMTVVFTSCEDKNENPAKDSPKVTGPSSATAVEFGGTVDLTFTIDAPGGIASVEASTSAGTVAVDGSGLVGETSGTVSVSYTAGSTAGAQTVTLSVTDQQNPAKTGAGIAAVDVQEEVTEVVVSANLAADATWTADKTYILATRVTVLDGVTLTIEPGTVIKGQAGAADNATALLVARGGTLNAVGTAAAPIIFTSVADEITPEQVAGGDFKSPNLAPDVNGLWGGVIVLGYAKISASNDDGDLTEVQIEGIPTSDPNGLYGGNDDTDDSGDIAYISIRHGGTNIGSGNEINGLTLGGVGSGTSITNVSIVANQDDGIEWFGGTVDMDKVIVWNQGDDGLDTDQAWNGTCSNFLLVAPQGGSGFELDGPEGTYSNGNHTFENGVLYAGDGIDHLVDFDPTTNAEIHNLYIYNIVQGNVEEYTAPPQVAMAWEYTLGEGESRTEAEIFGAVPSAQLSAVAENSNTVGYTADFTWTWASQSGKLAAIGLE
jgi:hypothetical protein